MKNNTFDLRFVAALMNLQLFADLNPNATTSDGLSVEMKTYYEDTLIDIAGPKLVHAQFGQKKPIPKNGGKTIEFRKYSPLPKLLTPIKEGETPKGQSLEVTKLEATVKQYGGYVTVTDVLQLTAIDNNIVEATELIGDQAGETLDTIVRDILNSGSNVQYGDDPTVNARHLLVGGQEEGNNYLNVRAIKMAVRNLKTQNAKRIDNSYVAIIHPDVAFDLTDDPHWENVKTYCDPDDMYDGEIGRIHGVRFVETTEAKVFHAEDLSETSRNLTVKSVSGATVTINEALTADDIEKLSVGRKIIIGAAAYIIVSAKANTLVLDSAPTVTEEGTVIYPGEAGAEGRDVYSTLVLGANAYGVTDINGGGLRHIVKQLGSGGTADPLDQRATVGWKAMQTAERLVEQYMVRIETASTFEVGAN